MCIYMEGSWDIPNTDSGPGKSKWLAKGNLKEMPHNTKSNYHKGVTQWLSWARLCVCPHKLYSFFPPKKYFTLFHYFLSLWKFFSAKLRGQGPCHWPLVPVARIQWSHCHDLTSISGWELKLFFKLLQAPWDQGSAQEAEMVPDTLFSPCVWLGPVLVSEGCCHRQLHTWWLQTTETYSFAVVEVTSLKSRCQQLMVTKGEVGGEG